MADADHEQPIYTDAKSQRVQATGNLLSKLTLEKMTILLFSALLIGHMYVEWRSSEYENERESVRDERRDEREAARDARVEATLNATAEASKQLLTVVEQANLREIARDERERAAQEREAREDQQFRELLQKISEVNKENC